MEILECGKIINTHGVRGELKVDNYCDEDFYTQVKEVLVDEKPYRILGSRLHKGFVLLRLEGVDTMDAAIALKNKAVFARRSDLHLKKGQFLYQDLYGFSVFDERVGRTIGTLREVLERPASILYAIDSEQGEILIPAVEPFHRGIDGENKVLTVRTIEGMLPDED